MANDYGALVGPQLSFEGVDQGIDFTGAGDVYAPFGAIVTRVEAGGSGWPGQGAVINLKLLEGPARGSYLYYAEDLSPLVRPGQTVRAGQKIATATGSGQAPGIEIGWARPSGIPLADRPPPRPADQYTEQGQSFKNFALAVSKGSGGGGGGGGVLGSIGHAVTQAATGNPIGAAASEIGAIPGDITSHIPGVSQVVSIEKFFGKITSASFLLRAGQVIAGGVLILVGSVLLVRQVGLAPDAPVPTVVNDTATAVE